MVMVLRVELGARSSRALQLNCARRLEYLYLGGNRLARVPDAIGALSRLTYLNLSENLLEHVPPALGRLRQLRVLDLVLCYLTPYCTHSIR